MDGSVNYRERELFARAKQENAVIDWFRIITDLERIYSQKQIGRAVGRNEATINRIKQGLIREPRYSVGVALMHIHVKLVQPTT